MAITVHYLHYQNNVQHNVTQYYFSNNFNENCKFWCRIVC